MTLAGLAATSQLAWMISTPADGSIRASQIQLDRFRMMSPAEKLACADSLWELVWDATKAGIRMRHPDADEHAVVREARAILARATD